MKKMFLPTVILLIFVLAACGGNASQEDLVERASSIAENVVDKVNEELSGPQEEACVIADIPAPSGQNVMVRFVNKSNGEVSLVWRDNSQSPFQLTEYTTLADGEVYDQLTFVAHEWLLMDEEDNLLLDFAASAELKQCAVAYPHFGYAKGEDGPEDWADLSKYYKTCGIGQEQSPIDLTNATLTDLENIVFNYGETAVNILNNGHTIQVDKIQGSHIVIGETTYALKQFHFHAPSEHAVDGQPYPIEMHLVHKDANEHLAVVAVLVTPGAENSAFTPAWDYLPEDETPGAIATGTSINVAALLPADQTVYRYKGSLTTPPCSEDVIWSVMSTPIEMSADQIKDFTSIISGNNRPLQPLNTRNFQLDQTP